MRAYRGSKSKPTTDEHLITLIKKLFSITVISAHQW
jgi:hypothetical protein